MFISGTPTSRYPSPLQSALYLPYSIIDNNQAYTFMPDFLKAEVKVLYAILFARVSMLVVKQHVDDEDKYAKNQESRNEDRGGRELSTNL